MKDKVQDRERTSAQIAQWEQLGNLNRVFSMVPGWELIKDLGEEVRLSKRGCILDESIDGGLGFHPCYLVISGSLATKVSRENKEALFYNIHQRGSLIYEARCMLGTSARDMYLEALEPTVLKRISHDELEAAAEADTDVYKLLLRSTNAKFVATCDQVREVRDLDAASRLYNLLVTLATTAEADDEGAWVSVGFRISQQMLADILGINRVTAAKALGQLIDLGKVMKEHGVYAVRKTALITRYRG